MPAQVGTDPSAFEEILRLARAKYGYIDVVFQTDFLARRFSMSFSIREKPPGGWLFAY